MKYVIISLIVVVIALIMISLFYFLWWRKRNTTTNEQRKGIGALTNDINVQQKDVNIISTNDKNEDLNTNDETLNKEKVNVSNKLQESDEKKTEQNKWNDFKENKQVNIDKIKNDVEISKPTEYLDFNELFVQPMNTDDTLYKLDMNNGTIMKGDYDSLMNNVDCQNIDEIDVSKLNDLKDFDKREFKNIESVIIEEAKKQTTFTLSGSNELF